MLQYLVPGCFSGLAKFALDFKNKVVMSTKIEKTTTLYLIFTAQASNFYHNALDILSPKIKMLSQQ